MPASMASAEMSSARWRLRMTRLLSARSEEHTSELQSQSNLVCRLLLEKKKNNLNHVSSRCLLEPKNHSPIGTRATTAENNQLLPAVRVMVYDHDVDPLLQTYTDHTHLP